MTLYFDFAFTVVVLHGSVVKYIALVILLMHATTYIPCNLYIMNGIIFSRTVVGNGEKPARIFVIMAPCLLRRQP